jgi:hypothetical protein
LHKKRKVAGNFILLSLFRFESLSPSGPRHSPTIRKPLPEAPKRTVNDAKLRQQEQHINGSPNNMAFGSDKHQQHQQQQKCNNHNSNKIGISGANIPAAPRRRASDGQVTSSFQQHVASTKKTKMDNAADGDENEEDHNNNEDSSTKNNVKKTSSSSSSSSSSRTSVASSTGSSRRRNSLLLGTTTTNNSVGKPTTMTTTTTSEPPPPTAVQKKTHQQKGSSLGGQSVDVNNIKQHPPRGSTSTLQIQQHRHQEQQVQPMKPPNLLPKHPKQQHGGTAAPAETKLHERSLPLPPKVANSSTKM